MLGVKEWESLFESCRAMLSQGSMEAKTAVAGIVAIETHSIDEILNIIEEDI